MMYALDRYAKAIVATIISALGSLQVALLDGNVSATEWVAVAVTALTALGITWAVPNSPPSPNPSAPLSSAPNQRVY